MTSSSYIQLNSFEMTEFIDEKYDRISQRNHTIENSFISYFKGAPFQGFPKFEKAAIDMLTVSSMAIGESDGPLFVFQDLFISTKIINGTEDKGIFFVAPVIDGKWNSESAFETRIFFELCLDDKGSRERLNSKVSSFIEYTESYIHGELTHPMLKQLLSSNLYVNVTVICVKDQSNNVTKEFKLVDEIPSHFARTENPAKDNLVLSTVFKSDDTRQVENYITFYRSFGVDSFLLYIHGSFHHFPHIRKLAEKYKRENVPVAFLEFNFGPYNHNTYLGFNRYSIHNIQLTAMMSAFLRARAWAKYIGFFDLDEYLITPPRFSNITEFLDHYDRKYNNSAGAWVFASLNAFLGSDPSDFER